jgi:hypothetical protein
VSEIAHHRVRESKRDETRRYYQSLCWPWNRWQNPLFKKALPRPEGMGPERERPQGVKSDAAVVAGVPIEAGDVA